TTPFRSRHIGFSCGIQRYVRLVPVINNFSTEHHPAVVLAAYGVLWRDGMDRLEELGLFGAHRVGVERDRRLHANHGEKLEQMVRHHVSERAGFFVEATATLDAPGVRGGKLHVGGMVAVPSG